MRKVSLVVASSLAAMALVLSACGSDPQSPAPSGVVPGADPDNPYLPYGTVWESLQISTGEVGRWHYGGSFEHDGTLWFFAGEHGQTVIYRSGDGQSFTRTVTGNGRIVDIASNGSTIVGVGAHDQGAIVHLSQDGGDSWREFQPAAMATPANSEQYLDAITYHRGEFLALGTVKSEDWRMTLYRSDDGVDWSKVQDLRGEGFAVSGFGIHSDGENLVILGEEHLCSEPEINSSAGGWYLGSWTHHFRVYQGTDPGGLAHLDDQQHPFVSAVVDYDCALRPAQLTETYASHTVIGSDVVGGVITMLGSRVEAEGSPPEIVELIDGQWRVSADDTLSETRGAVLSLVDAGGYPAVFAYSRDDRRIRLTERPRDVWEDVSSAHQMMPGSYYPPAPFKGARYALSSLPADLFAPSQSGSPVLITVWKSSGMASHDFGSCALESTACEYLVAAQLPGFPSVGAIDLSDKTLDLAVLSGADLTGADFSSAQLFGAFSDAKTVLHGADFTGASVTHALLRNVGGADFSGADARGATLTYIETTPLLTGANLTGATVRADIMAFGEHEWSLSLVDAHLRDATIAGGLLSAQKLVVSSLRGAVIEGTSFRNVDLRGADINGVDLSTARFDADSICPDGNAPMNSACG